jgi:hypothetical protein
MTHCNKVNSNGDCISRFLIGWCEKAVQDFKFELEVHGRLPIGKSGRVVKIGKIPPECVKLAGMKMPESHLKWMQNLLLHDTDSKFREI